MFFDLDLPGLYANAYMTPLDLYSTLVLNIDPIADLYPELFNEDRDMTPEALIILEGLILHRVTDMHRLTLHAGSNDGENITLDLRLPLSSPMSLEDGKDVAERYAATMATLTHVPDPTNVFEFVAQITNKLARRA